jgi:multidrug efflux pump subunit AcrA (membrane-fusion protein)
MRASAGERAMVMVGVLPLLAAALWLVLLRQPRPVAAHRGAGDAPQWSAERDVPLEPRFIGVVVAGQDAQLGAELVGEVSRVFAEPGTRVRRGDALLQLNALAVVGAQGIASAQAAEDRSAIESARLSLESARDKAERMQSARDAYAARDITSARADVARAAAELARLRAGVDVHRATRKRELARADKQIVRAPFDGVLALRFVDVGDFVSAGQVLARVVDDARFVRFALPAGEHARLRVADSVQVYAQPTQASGMPLTAAVTDVDPELDAAAGLGFARAKLTGDAALLLWLSPGSRVAVALPQLAAGGHP